MPSPLTSKIVNLQEIFNLLDKSGNGSVESAKIGDLLRSAGLNPTEQDLQGIQKNLKGEKISFAEYSQVYQEFLESDLSHDLNLSSISHSSKTADRQPDLQAMINAVRTFDHQGTGFISQAELQFILTGLGDKLTDEEFAKLRAFMDITPSGQISYEQFITTVLNS